MNYVSKKKTSFKNKLVGSNYLLCLLVLFQVSIFAASDKPLAGIILNSETKEPLPFTNIVVLEQYKGTVSNSEGYFVLDREGIAANDTLLFSYVGYKSVKISAAEVQSKSKIYLQPIKIKLDEVQVSSRPLSAKEIIALVIENYPKNHPAFSARQRIFYHKYEKVPFPENQIILKESDFVGLDRNTFNELMKMMPREFIEYQDAIVDLYSYGDKNKLVPIEGISLEEGSQKDILKELENSLSVFIDDIQKSIEDTTIYYKFRSGVFADKMEMDDSIGHEFETDPLIHSVSTDHVRGDVLSVFNEYANMESDNWEFLNKSGKYKYKNEQITLLNDELVYEISFTPKSRGLFEGTIYVSTSSYAILQLDFVYSEGKRTENFHLLGVGHSVDSKSGRVIYAKANAGYYPKYISTHRHESASVERKFSIMKKQKRFLTDKELNEMKFKTQLFLDINSYREILVLDREEIDEQQFGKIKQPEQVEFRKEYAYTPEMWDNSTVLAPAAELQKFKRK